MSPVAPCRQNEMASGRAGYFPTLSHLTTGSDKTRSALGIGPQAIMCPRPNQFLHGTTVSISDTVQGSVVPLVPVSAYHCCGHQITWTEVRQARIRSSFVRNGVVLSCVCCPGELRELIGKTRGRCVRQLGQERPTNEVDACRVIMMFHVKQGRR